MRESRNCWKEGLSVVESRQPADRGLIMLLLSQTGRNIRRQIYKIFHVEHTSLLFFPFEGSNWGIHRVTIEAEVK